MADLSNYGSSERDIEQALTVLKRGSQLVKYSRQGKPKVCPFRLSADETTLIWYSRGEERNLKLASVSKIIPGQRTAVFRRYLRPEKDYLSFSLIYNNGERSLDLICKDKVESEVWFAGLKALISTGQRKRSKFDESSERSSSYSGEFVANSGINHNPFGATLDNNNSVNKSPPPYLAGFRDPSVNLARTSTDVVLASSEYAKMQLRGSGDGFRLSVSSLPSTSSQSSGGHDDCESLGDVYIWGEVWFDTPPEGGASSSTLRTDVLLPKPLESNVVLDVSQIACGVRHAALITKQGEVFTWGEESGGRLGYAGDADIVCKPQLVDSLAVSNVEQIACGEYHSCAITGAGELFTWGDGTPNAGLLGHGTDVSHWPIPKRLSGPLEGLQVSSLACGTWHTALTTSNGHLFTFGDGTFGVLGHGNRETAMFPKEVESLRGLKTIKVACGVWHTAAMVEVIVAQHGSGGGAGGGAAHVSSRKLFTWGDGDKFRLGHGDKEARLVPTCVSSLIDYNFLQLACGHNITVGLTTSGHVFTMGSSSNGQLGNPQSDGKVPCLVQDRLVGECVEEIACGSHHVAVLTSRSEVYTWGKGANGRLGHGDVEDRKTPCFVESLRDRHVRNISCGSNFTAIICQHKWVSGADQSICSGCKLPFGFTRKRHNCYNCGLVHCHGCSSKKALKAALAPTPGKPHRVCEQCYVKLKAAENTEVSSVTFKKNILARRTFGPKERLDKGSPKVLQTLNVVTPIKYFEAQPTASNARSVSPFPRRPSPPRSVSPIPTLSGGANISKSMFDRLKKTNELLNQEVLKLTSQVKNLRQRCENQELELQKSEKRAQEASLKCEEECEKRNVVKEVVKSLGGQLKEVMQKLPPDLPQNDIQNLIDQLSAIANGAVCGSSSSVEDLQRNEERYSFEHTSNAHDITLDRRSVDSDDGGGAEAKAPNGTTSATAQKSKDEIESQWVEQFESGVYVTLLRLKDGTKVLKKVKFSRKRFAERQAEVWWEENHTRLFEKYNVRGIIEKPPSYPITTGGGVIPSTTTSVVASPEGLEQLPSDVQNPE